MTQNLRRVAPHQLQVTNLDARTLSVSSREVIARRFMAAGRRLSQKTRVAAKMRLESRGRSNRWRIEIILSFCPCRNN